MDMAILRTEESHGASAPSRCASRRRRTNLDGHPRNTTVEARLRFRAYCFDDGRAEIDADVRSLIRREETRLGMLDPRLSNLFAIDEQRAQAALAWPPPSLAKSKRIVALPGARGLLDTMLLRFRPRKL